MELKKSGLICLIGLMAVIALFILFSTSFTTPNPCESSPQYFIQIENISGGEYENSLPDAVRKKLLDEGYQICDLNESVFTRYPSIHQSIESPKSQVFINTSDVKKLTDFAHDTVFSYKQGYYMLIIGHYDRAGC